MTHIHAYETLSDGSRICFECDHSIPAQKERHEAETRALVLHALDDTGWMLGAAAEALDIPASNLQRLIDRLGLRDVYQEKSPGRGRPKKPAGDC